MVSSAQRIQIAVVKYRKKILKKINNDIEPSLFTLLAHLKLKQNINKNYL